MTRAFTPPRPGATYIEQRLMRRGDRNELRNVLIRIGRIRGYEMQVHCLGYCDASGRIIEPFEFADRAWWEATGACQQWREVEPVRELAPVRELVG